jgi:hypothetical protein
MPLNLGFIGVANTLQILQIQSCKHMVKVPQSSDLIPTSVEVKKKCSVPHLLPCTSSTSSSVLPVCSPILSVRHDVHHQAH